MESYGFIYIGNQTIRLQAENQLPLRACLYGALDDASWGIEGFAGIPAADGDAKAFFCGTSAGVCPAYTAVFLSELQGC